MNMIEFYARQYCSNKNWHGKMGTLKSELAWTSHALFSVQILGTTSKLSSMLLLQKKPRGILPI